MKGKMIRKLCGVTAAYMLLALLMTMACRNYLARPWYEKYSVVCHALGRTKEGDSLTNSKEAFFYNYQRGQRVFEADIQITSDGVMVLRHDWGSDLGQADSFGWTEERGAVTAEEFLTTPIYGQYTPLSLKDWFAIMHRYPDIYLVTDTKYSQEVGAQFELFVDTAIDNGYEDVLSRVIVQIYYREMYGEVMEVYPFENMIWTLYYTGYPDRQEVIDFMSQTEIPVLVMPSSWWYGTIQDDLENSGVKVYVHTVNDDEEARQRMEHGISGIYSDDILPKTVRQWQKVWDDSDSG
ncbi:MAG: hypothetical protein NC331_12925 [Lachnospiraceae bacterium]|nr:hypothetical protein [Lachnospiraceae bacterium]MCM1240268.1 hypothetical protein [Lachnospiraceae bacterium]